MNRTITTNLYTILDLLSCAEDFGFADDIFYSTMFDIIKPVSESEIRQFAETYNTPEMQERGYSEESVRAVEGKLRELNNQYGR